MVINGISYAKETIVDESYSPDGDFIDYRKISLIYDANNNGVFGDAGDQTVVLSESHDRNYIETVKSFDHLTPDAGKSQAVIEIHESYDP